MLTSTSRRLTIALAAGALTLFGAAGALAAGPTETDPGGGRENSPQCNDLPLSWCLPGPGETPGNAHPSDESNPLCTTPLSATPICASPSEPPGEGGGGGGGGDTGPGGGSPSTADEGNPVCTGTPVALQSTPLCAPEDGKEKTPEEGTQPSAEDPNPLCGTPLSATPICASPSEPPGEGGGGGSGDTGPGGGSPSAAPADEGGGASPVCILMPTDPSCQPSQGPGSGGGGDTQPSPGGPGGGGDGATG